MCAARVHPQNHEYQPGHELTSAHLLHIDEPDAAVSAARRRAADAADLVCRTRFTVTNPAELAAKIAQVHLQGWFLVNQELQEGLVSVAAPVFNNAGKMTAAFNISDQANRTSAKTMRETR